MGYAFQREPFSLRTLFPSNPLAQSKCSIEGDKGRSIVAKTNFEWQHGDGDN